MFSPRDVINDLCVWCHLKDFHKATDHYNAELDKELQIQDTILQRYKLMTDSQAHVNTVSDLADQLTAERKTNGT